MRSAILGGDTIQIIFETKIFVRPGVGYIHQRDAKYLQVIKEVSRLVGIISNPDESIMEGDLEQRQIELMNLLKKIFTEGRYLEVRGVVVEMFQRIRKNQLFAFTDPLFPELNKMS